MTYNLKRRGNELRWRVGTILRSFSTRDFIFVFPRMSHKQKGHLVSRWNSFHTMNYFIYYFVNYTQDISCLSTIYIVFALWNSLHLSICLLFGTLLKTRSHGTLLNENKDPPLNGWFSLHSYLDKKKLGNSCCWMSLIRMKLLSDLMKLHSLSL